MVSESETEGGILRFLATIDIRIVYFLLFVVVVGPLLYPIGMPISVSPDTVEFHDVIAEMGPDDIVLLHLGTEFSGWNELSAGSTASMRMLIEQGAKVAIISAHPEAISISPLLYNSLSDVMDANDYKYMEDTIDLGYMHPNEAAVASTASDFHGTVRTDYLGASIEGTFLDDINTAEDWSLIVDIQTGVQSAAMLNHYRVSYGAPIAKHCIGVSVPGAKADLDAELLVGVLPSLRGGAELETLIGAKGPGVAAMDAFSIAHYMLLIFVVLGNIGYFGYQRSASRRTTVGR